MKIIDIKNYGLDNLRPGDLIKLTSEAIFELRNKNETIEENEVVMIKTHKTGFIYATVFYKNKLGRVILNDEDLVVIP